MGSEKRRSDRLMLTIPLIVEGTDARGHPFRDDARTISLNRNGARIHTARPLRVSQTISVTNLICNREASFCVVGPVAPITEKGGEWGVEYASPSDNIWGIQFPPVSAAEGSESTALLECRECHSVVLMRLSLVEVEVLETSGILSKPCAYCEHATPWGFTEKQVAMSGPAEEENMMAQAQASARGAEQRKHRRIALQLPVRVRDYYGGSEVARTENVSKGGFCFVSERHYHVGGGVLVVCPYNPAAEIIEIRARIVRQREVEGTNRKIYGVRYDQAGV